MHGNFNGGLRPLVWLVGFIFFVVMMLRGEFSLALILGTAFVTWIASLFFE